MYSIRIDNLDFRPQSQKNEKKVKQKKVGTQKKPGNDAVFLPYLVLVGPHSWLLILRDQNTAFS